MNSALSQDVCALEISKFGTAVGKAALDRVKYFFVFGHCLGK
jgi:hypothetical protein